ncbi:mechanosensitive ion channel protein MscS [Pontibacter silvestris]|uniref:Mechanosensitive ion channel protein MscS n=1 Tax=Pontibacter silvestris TaxID=2305183 RepID=A0ABW4WYV3_9BACT|nr:mechanosensitive ion channel protein MscS [Pontibacter silvestris]MCC9135526.1 mechanosensitive ion channel protein MscS [Pontibacter silvestris]
MLKNIIYAILLGVGMAACLSQSNNKQETSKATASEPATESIPTNDEEMAVPAPENFVIAKDRAGYVRLNMPIEEMRQSVPNGMDIADTTLQTKGQPSTAYLLQAKDAARGLLIEQTCAPTCEVWRIQVQHPDFKTSSGIGIGSKYSEVQSAYPISYVSPGEAGLVAVSEDANFSFVLDSSHLPAEQLAKLKPEDVPANTIVKSILIY